MTPGPFGLRQQFPQPKDHAALVLGEDLDRADDVDHGDEEHNQERWDFHFATSVLANRQLQTVDPRDTNARALRYRFLRRRLPDFAVCRDASG